MQIHVLVMSIIALLAGLLAVMDADANTCRLSRCSVGANESLLSCIRGFGCLPGVGVASLQCALERPSLTLHTTGMNFAVQRMYSTVRVGWP